MFSVASPPSSASTLFPVFGCLTVSSVLTRWYTQGTPLRSHTSTSGQHSFVSFSQIKIPFTHCLFASHPSPALPSLPYVSQTFWGSVCNLDELTGLHSGVMTARRAAFLSFTFVWIMLVSGCLPSTAGYHVSSVPSSLYLPSDTCAHTHIVNR